MEAPRRAGDIWRLPSEEGQGDLSRRWQPRPTGEALSHSACAGRGLTSTIHVAQGREIFPIIMLDETMTPTHVFIAMISLILNSILKDAARGAHDDCQSPQPGQVGPSLTV
jgi:hypothetical protein